MFIVMSHYKTTLDEVDKYLSEHRRFLDYYYKQGLLLASGPTNPRTGGVILALTSDKAYLESILANDPFVLADIADYQLLEFTPVMHRTELKELIATTEGFVC